MKEPPKRGDVLLIRSSDIGQSNAFPKHRLLSYEGYHDRQETHVILYLGTRTIISRHGLKPMIHLGLLADGNIIILYSWDIERSTVIR